MTIQCLFKFLANLGVFLLLPCLYTRTHSYTLEYFGKIKRDRIVSSEFASTFSIIRDAHKFIIRISFFFSWIDSLHWSSSTCYSFISFASHSIAFQFARKILWMHASNYVKNIESTSIGLKRFFFVARRLFKRIKFVGFFSLAHLQTQNILNVAGRHLPR